MTDSRALAQAERADLAALLTTLTPEQWDSPSLCAKWRVRDVVAHVIGFDVQGMTGYMRTLVLAGGSPNRANQLAVDALRELDPWCQSMSVACSRRPRVRAAARIGVETIAKSRTARSRSGSISRGRPSGRRMSWWWMAPSVSAMRYPCRAVMPSGVR